MKVWTEERDILICKLRLTGMMRSEIAEEMTQRMNRQNVPVTAASIQNRLSKRGVVSNSTASWIVERDQELMRAVTGEVSLEKALDELREKDEWDWLASGRKIRYEQLKWQHEHLSDVPTDPDEWPAYRAHLIHPLGPPCWRCKDELVIRHPAGRSSICPACMDRPSRRSLLQVALQRTIPRARYQNDWKTS